MIGQRNGYSRVPTDIINAPPAVVKAFLEPLHDRTTWCPTLAAKAGLYFTQAIAFVLSSTALSCVVAWACILNLVEEKRHRRKYAWDKKEDEECTKDMGYYARRVGLDILNGTAETEDGYYLRVHRVVNPQEKQRGAKGGYPILITHGLFQCSGCFVTSEDRSLAFWLAKQGYQVFLGNNRGVWDMGHREYSRGDPRFWDWTIQELAQYDLPAMIDYVRKVTGYDKITLLGHSQGAGAAFIAMSRGMRPEIGEKLSNFVALAPAVYAGPLTSTWLFRTLGSIDWDSWQFLFGKLDFIPLMRYAYDWVPWPGLFGYIGYAMFSYLFSWTDRNWLLRRRNKKFRFTPTPVSSAGVFWWCGKGGFATQGCTLDTSMPQWFDSRFPPLSIYYGGRDFLVDVDTLLERLKTSEPDVKIIRTVKLDEAEHCDFYYAAEALEWCFKSFVEDIEKTRPRDQDNELIST